MKKFIFLLLPLLVALPGQSAKKKYKVVEKPTYEEYVAQGIAQFAKDMETVGGMVRWLEEELPEKDMKAVKKWLIKNNIPENQYLPDVKVKGATVTVGRDQLTLKKDHIVLNKKKFKYKTMNMPQSLDKFCKHLDCFGKKTSQFENPLFPKAHAILGFLTGKFFLGMVVGAIFHRPILRVGRGIFSGARRLFRSIFRPRRGHRYTRYNAANPGERGGYRCENGRVIFCPLSEDGCREMPEGALEDGRSCEQNTAALNAVLEERERRGIDEGVHPAGARAVTGEKPKKAPPVKGK